MKDYFSKWEEENDDRLEANYWGNVVEDDKQPKQEGVEDKKEQQDDFKSDKNSKGKQLSFVDVEKAEAEAQQQ